MIYYMKEEEEKEEEEEEEEEEERKIFSFRLLFFIHLPFRAPI